jgi:hypothetical protein
MIKGQNMSVLNSWMKRIPLMCMRYMAGKKLPSVGMPSIDFIC